MKNPLRYWAAAAVGAAASLAFSSCTYDPYYSSAGGYYGSAYGDGYGYGGSGFSTSVFVATGDPRWGYDPYCYSYYDYNRHCYYDPYLNGYYPMGYRPAVVFGVPHPYGWSPGHGYCPPPRHVNYAMAVNYRNRESAYRNSNYGWAHQVHTQPAMRGNAAGQYQPRNGYNQQNSYNQQNAANRQPSHGGNFGRPQAGTQPAAGAYQGQNQHRNPYAAQGRGQGYGAPNANGAAQGNSRQHSYQPQPGQNPQQPRQPRQFQPSSGQAPQQPRQFQPQSGQAAQQPRQFQAPPGRTQQPSARPAGQPGRQAPAPQAQPAQPKRKVDPNAR
jgi:hypothetical protein